MATTQVKASEDATKELETWGSESIQTIETMKGEKIQYSSKLNWGKELSIRAILSKGLSTVMPKLGSDEALGEEAFSFFFGEFPKLLVGVVAIILEKDEAWVREELDGTTGQEIANPFVSNFFAVPMLPGMEETESVAPPEVKSGKRRSQK